MMFNLTYEYSFIHSNITIIILILSSQYEVFNTLMWLPGEILTRV